MALSKLPGVTIDTETISARINKVYGNPTSTMLDPNEIRIMCNVSHERAISVELIHHMLGGPNMEYRFIEVTESFEAFDFLREELIEDLKQSKMEILFLEDRKCVNSNIIAVIVKKEKKHGSREHIVLKCLVRITVMLEPRVGYCRFFDLTGELVS